MWHLTRLLAVAAAATLVQSPVASADPAVHPGKVAAPFMRVFGPSLPPFGYVRFCHEYPAECVRSSAEDKRIEATPVRLAELDGINRKVNRDIKPATDLEIYGEIERWALPVDRGDCEDYALLKRHILIERGWPASSLLMTVVRDEKGEGHAILTARTSKGDYILDNKTDELKLWSRTPYKYVMRQSYLDPNVWLSLDAGAAHSPALIGSRSAP